MANGFAGNQPGAKSFTNDNPTFTEPPRITILDSLEPTKRRVNHANPKMEPTFRMYFPATPIDVVD